MRTPSSAGPMLSIALALAGCGPEDAEEVAPVEVASPDTPPAVGPGWLAEMVRLADPLDIAEPLERTTRAVPDAGAPSPDADAGVALSCAVLARVPTEAQVAIVEADLDCASTFVERLVAEPSAHLEAFFGLVGSTVASDALWRVVYEALGAGRFVFGATVVEQLTARLGGAVPACPATQRCEDWHTYVVAAVRQGLAYRCPASFAELSTAELVAGVPLGDYDCTEALAAELGGRATAPVVEALIAVAGTHPVDWGRRNAIRVLGRFAERPADDAAHLLVLEGLASAVRVMALERLRAETSADVLDDAIWLLDAQLFPTFEAQPHLQAIVADRGIAGSARFRAASASSRLIQVRGELLSPDDAAFLVDSLSLDDPWLRAQAAFTMAILPDARLDPAIVAAFVAALDAAYAVEAELFARLYLARALDRFRGTDLSGELRVAFEATHLPNTVSGGGITVRSGLPVEALGPLLTRLQHEREAFFDLLGADFEAPVPGDTNDSATILVFATQAAYAEYMDGFVGFGGAAGGLYLEGSATLYTYDRQPWESSYTLEELLQHEFGHYLQGRHVYPGLWGHVGDFVEPRGWADEGFAELLGGLELDADGAPAAQLRPAQVATLCSEPFRALDALLSQRSGYDQPGTFDYVNGWSFSHFFFASRREDARRVYRALREGTYALGAFAALAAVPSIGELEVEWHAAMGEWCAASAGPGSAAASVGLLLSPTPPRPSVCSTVERVRGGLGAAPGGAAPAPAPWSPCPSLEDPCSNRSAPEGP
jgi:hypothetical protein